MTTDFARAREARSCGDGRRKANPNPSPSISAGLADGRFRITGLHREQRSELGVTRKSGSLAAHPPTDQVFRILLPLLGIALVACAAFKGGWMWLIAWLGVDFFALGVAHIRGANSLFGKRRDGGLPLWSWIVFLPLHLFTLAIWHTIRLISREPACNVVDESLVIGRRLLPSELPGEFENYVDLAAEFAEPGKIRQSPGYVSFPMLDGSAATPDALQADVGRLRPGRTYIHCAQGHGRTATFAMTLLVATGKAANAAEALERLRAVRPGLRVNWHQRAIVEAATAGSGVQSRIPARNAARRAPPC